MGYPRILVIRGGAIGDFIMTLPVLAALRERWPEAHLEVLGYPHITGLAQHYVNATRSMEARALAGFYVPNGILDPTWMDYFGSFAVIVSYLFDPDEIFANNVKRCGVKQYLPASPRPTDLPAARHYCQPLEALAIYVAAPVPRVVPTDAARAVAAKFLAKLGRERVVAIHPGSGSEKKNWPAANFGAVARWLVEELAAQLVVVHGEADERAVSRLLAELAARPVTLATGLKLVELAAVLERCALYLGNDSGVTHLAAAVGVPVVALFGPASPAIWQPPQPNARIVAFGEQDVATARQAIGEMLRAVES